MCACVLFGRGRDLTLSLFFLVWSLMCVCVCTEIEATSSEVESVHGVGNEQCVSLLVFVVVFRTLLIL